LPLKIAEIAALAFFATCVIVGGFLLFVSSSLRVFPTSDVKYVDGIPDKSSGALQDLKQVFVIPRFM